MGCMINDLDVLNPSPIKIIIHNAILEVRINDRNYWKIFIIIGMMDSIMCYNI